MSAPPGTSWWQTEKRSIVAPVKLVVPSVAVLVTWTVLLAAPIVNLDFAAPVPGTVVDKDGSPRWRPGSLKDVSDAVVAHAPEAPKQAESVPRRVGDREASPPHELALSSERRLHQAAPGGAERQCGLGHRNA